MTYKIIAPTASAPSFPRKRESSGVRRTTLDSRLRGKDETPTSRVNVAAMQVALQNNEVTA